MQNTQSTKPAIKLSYFDLSGGRGEACRLALHLAGVEFEDVRIPFSNWGETKSTMPYGQMPVLEIEGEGVLAQSNPILELIGARYGLLPENQFTAAQHSAILNYVSDLDTRISLTVRIEDDEQRKTARQKLSQEYMTTWADNIEDKIEGPFFGGEQISVADLKVFVLIKWVKKGVLDGIPTDQFDGSEKINAFFNAVDTHPKVVEWYKNLDA